MNLLKFHIDYLYKVIGYVICSFEEAKKFLKISDVRFFRNFFYIVYVDIIYSYNQVSRVSVNSLISSGLNHKAISFLADSTESEP